MSDKVFDPLNDEKSSLSLAQVCATDLMVVNAAKVSFGASSTEMGDHEKGVLRHMMQNGHGSPYEHNLFTFHVRCPIFVAREWMRHRIGSFNEYSARYKEMKPDFYIPATSDIRVQIGKSSEYTFEEFDSERVNIVTENMDHAIRAAWDAYRANLSMGVAKEVARNVLPVCIYTEFYWTVNARSLMNFLRLRTHESALREIRYFAECVEILFATHMPLTHANWIENNKVTP